MIFIYVHNSIFVTFIINHVVVFEVHMAATMMIAVFWNVVWNMLPPSPGEIHLP